jgi:hypothetical protein
VQPRYSGSGANWSAKFILQIVMQTKITLFFAGLPIFLILKLNNPIKNNFLA